MKHRKVFVTIASILFSHVLFAQLKDRLVFNLGIQHCNLYQQGSESNKEKLLVLTNQEPVNLIDLNFSYEINSQKSRIFPSIGIGFNQKGFKNQVSDSRYHDPVFYSKVEDYSFLSFLSAINYQSSTTNKLRFLAGQAIVPEMLISKEPLLKNFGLSSRTSVALSYSVNKTLAVRFSPYFQTAIINYNKMKVQTESGNYKPFSFGLSLGASFIR